MLAVGNQTGDYIFTNRRLGQVISLLGFEYHNSVRMNITIVELDFNVVIDEWLKPEVIIAKGSITNIQREQQETARI